MWKRKGTYLVSLAISLLVIVAILFGCAPAAPPTVIKLSSTNYLPAAHIFTPMFEEWGKEVMKRSNGRVEITYFPGGSLLTAPKVPDGLATGVADIGHSHIGYNPGRFPECEALQLPMGYPTGWVGTFVAKDFLDKYKPKEWDKLVLLFAHGGNTSGIHMSKKPIRKLEDFKGTTMRGAGEVADAIAALGATPRDVPMPEVYEAMSKGTIDGLLVGIETLKAFKLAEVSKYSTFAWPVGNMYMFYWAMNRDKWNSLPDDIKKVFNQVNEEYIPKFALTWNKINKEGFEYGKSLGVEVIALPPDEIPRWKAAVAPVADKYVEKMVAKGYSAQEMKNRIAFIKERVDFWTKKQAEQKVPSEFDFFK